MNDNTKSTVRTRTVRAVLACLALAVFAALNVGLPAAPAQAASTRCAFYGIGIKYGVRNGSVCSSVNGSGTYVTTVTATYGTTVSGPDAVCNPSLKIDVYDRGGRWVASRQGPQRGGCYPWAFNSAPGIGVYWGFPQASGGSIRVTLQSYGQPVAVTVHGLS